MIKKKDLSEKDIETWETYIKNPSDVYDKDKNNIRRETKKSNLSSESNSKGDFEHFMLKEIFEQPEAVKSTIQDRIINNTIPKEILGQNAEKFIDKNVHIISDKPYAGNLDQAIKLHNKIKSNKRIKYALTHNYSAYPMVREAKVLVEKGKIGKVEYVNVEYIQDWSNGKKVNPNNAKKIFRWRLEKKIAGISTVLNEIGSHAYHLCNYITGLKGKNLFADIKQYSKKIKFFS